MYLRWSFLIPAMYLRRSLADEPGLLVPGRRPTARGQADVLPVRRVPRVTRRWAWPPRWCRARHGWPVRAGAPRRGLISKDVGVDPAGKRLWRSRFLERFRGAR